MNGDRVVVIPIAIGTLTCLTCAMKTCRPYLSRRFYPGQSARWRAVSKFLELLTREPLVPEGHYDRADNGNDDAGNVSKGLLPGAAIEALIERLTVEPLNRGYPYDQADGQRDHR